MADEVALERIRLEATAEKRCLWVGWPPSGRMRVADNPETLEAAGCVDVRRIDPVR